MDKEKQQVYEVTHAIFNSRNKGERVVLRNPQRGSWHGPWYWGHFTRLDDLRDTHDKIRVKKIEGEFLSSEPTAPLHTGHMAVRE